MLKVPGISNLTFVNANKFGTQLFQGVDEAGMPVLVSTKNGLLYKVIKKVSSTSTIKTGATRNDRVIRVFDNWSNIQSNVESSVSTKDGKVIKSYCTLRHLNMNDCYIGRGKVFNQCLENDILVTGNEVIKYNDIGRPFGNLGIAHIRRDNPDKTYTIETIVDANGYIMPNGTLRKGTNSYTRTFSADGKLISNKKSNPGQKISCTYNYCA